LAQESAVEIAELAATLGSPDEAVRRGAYESLGELPARALPAIRERLGQLVGTMPEDTQQILHEIRRATGSRRADDLVDVADGIPALLERRRDRNVLVVAEPLLLLRSLERIANTDALSAIPEVLRLERSAWSMEGRRATLRLGDRVAAAVIRARSHEDPAGRDWARWSSQELSLEPPGRLVSRLGPRDLADLLSAWGATRNMDAMPVVASFVDDHRRFVREAARDALLAYGQNGIWQAREQFRLRLGEDAEMSWGHRRTMQELSERLDRQRLLRIQDLAARAEEAIERNDPDSATRSLEALLARAPDVSSNEIASLFARAGVLWMDTMPAARDRARTAFERAARLAPTHEGRSRWEARLAFLDAEDALEAGVLDVDAYQRAASGDPTCSQCARMISTIEAQSRPVDSPANERRAAALVFAAVLFAALGAVLLMNRGTTEVVDHDEAEHDEQPDLSDMTLPGV
jgi:hypothetical protein